MHIVCKRTVTKVNNEQESYNDSLSCREKEDMGFYKIILKINLDIIIVEQHEINN